MSYKTYKVDDEDVGARFDKWFRRNVTEIPQGLLQKLMRKGAIKVSGKKQDGSYRLQAGDEIMVLDNIEIAPTSETERPVVQKKIPENWIKEIKSRVIYKDADVIAINKPSGLAVQGGSGISISVDDLLEFLKFDAKEKPKLVHRLDKDTSGVLLLARNTKTAAYLTGAFRTKDVEKMYWALVSGVPSIRKGEIRINMQKKYDENDFEKVHEDEAGKDSITRYRVLESIGKNFSVLEMFPLTGRTHQLRVHALHIGHPIFGDNKYGERTGNLKSMSIANKLHLHARKVTFTSPSGKKLTIVAPLTGHMKETWKTLEIEEK